MLFTTEQSSRLRSICVMALICGAVLFLAGCQANSQSTYAPTADGVMLSSKEARLLERGKKAFENANYGLAQKHFMRATDFNPENSAAWLGLAAAYDKLGEFSQADTAYRQLVRLRGTTALVLNNMAYSQLLRGDKATALKLLEQAKKLAPNSQYVMGNMVLLDKIA